MRRIATALVLLFVAGTQAAGASLGHASPTLRVVTRYPVVVRGAHFRPTERVTVRAHHIVRVVHSTETGAFRARLGTVATDRCSSWIVAVGARGDQARVRLRGPRPQCAPA
jgi:hypothetical protein